jgi:hypothetical protein
MVEPRIRKSVVITVPMPGVRRTKRRWSGGNSENLWPRVMPSPRAQAPAVALRAVASFFAGRAGREARHRARRRDSR